MPESSSVVDRMNPPVVISDHLIMLHNGGFARKKYSFLMKTQKPMGKSLATAQ